MSAKKLRRFLSVLLSLSMVLSVNTVNFAAEAGEADADTQVHTEADANGAPGAEAAAQEGHVHDWVYSHDLRPATCVKAGVAVYQCQNDGCDAVKGQKYEAIPKLGHLFDPTAEDYEEGKGYTTEILEGATCQKEGSAKHVCQRMVNGELCGAEETVALPKTDHQWDEENPKSTVANCLEGAKTYIGCKHCDAVKPGSEQEDPEHPALGHGYERENKTEGTDYTKKATQATCTTEGYTEYTCLYCEEGTEGHTNIPEGEKVPALGHGYKRDGAAENTDYTKETTAATCTTEGGEKYTCLHCTAETEGHTWIPEDKKVPALGHGYDRKDGVKDTDYTEEPVPVTCITEGYTKYTCLDPNCPNKDSDQAEVHRNKVPALGHGYARKGAAEGKDYEKETVPATCTADGYTTYTCKYCAAGVDGHTLTPEDEKVKGGHQWGAEKVEVAEANCKDPAQYDYVCAVCEAEKGEREPRGTADAGSHVFDQEDPEHSSEFKPATCAVNGLARLTCTFCEKATKFVVVEAAHDYKETRQEPTCTQDGLLTKACQRGDKCDAPETKNVTETLPKTGHKYTSEVTTPATCTQKGVTTKTCQNCGDVVTEDIPVNPDNHTNWSQEVTQSATCTKPGFTGKYCLDCGALHEDAKKTGDALGHAFERMTDEEFVAYVDTLKDDPEHAGKKYVEVTKSATCTATGTMVYTCPDCQEANNTKEVTIPKASHDWDDTYIAPTCTENAKFVQICGDCGAEGETTDLGSMGEDYKATGHKYTKLVEIFRDETCARNGVAQYKCETCDLTENRVIPAAHKYEVVQGESTPATCTAAGKEVKVCQRENCDDPGHKRVETTINALGHDFDEGTATTPANCVEKGVLTKTCSRCGTTTTEEIPVNPAAHKNMHAVTNQEATCTTPKIVSGSYCDACGTYSDDAVTEGEELGHSFERMTDAEFEAYVETLKDDPQYEGKEFVKVTKPATCTAAGTKVYTCPDCQVENNTKNVEIPKLGHHFVDKYTPPTCTENGKVQKVCDRNGCGVTDGPAEDLGDLDKKLGHHIVTVKGKKATCQEPGLTDGKKCDRPGCDYVETEQETIPADTVNGHDWSGTGLDDDYREATCTKPGFVTHYCVVPGCGESKTDVLDAGHDWEEKFADGEEAFAEADTILYRVCSRYGAEDCDADPYEVLVVMPGAGYCEKCKKYVWKETVEGTPATCTKDGLTEGEVCGNGCGYVFTEQEKIGKLGHRDTAWQVKAAPTCNKEGIEEEICGVCKEATGQTRTVPATGKHQYVSKLTDATCTTNDIINSVCKVCGQLNPNNVPQELPGTALGHDFGEDDVCSRCHKGRAYAGTAVSAYKDGTANKIRFTATAGVADEERYQLLGRGILYITGKAYCEDPASTGAEMVVNISEGSVSTKNGVRHTPFPPEREEDNYYIAINVTGNEDRKLWARAYTWVMDLDTGENVVFYGDILNASFNSVTGTAE